MLVFRLHGGILNAKQSLPMCGEEVLMIKVRFHLFMAVLLAVPFAAKNAAAATFYVTAAKGEGEVYLYTVDSEDGTTELIGLTGKAVRDLAMDSAGNLWADCDRSLCSINTETGEATIISEGAYDGGYGAIAAVGEEIFLARSWNKKSTIEEIEQSKGGYYDTSTGVNSQDVTFDAIGTQDNERLTLSLGYRESDGRFYGQLWSNIDGPDGGKGGGIIKISDDGTAELYPRSFAGWIHDIEFYEDVPYAVFGGLNQDPPLSNGGNFGTLNLDTGEFTRIGSEPLIADHGLTGLALASSDAPRLWRLPEGEEPVYVPVAPPMAIFLLAALLALLGIRYRG